MYRCVSIAALALHVSVIVAEDAVEVEIQSALLRILTNASPVATTFGLREGSPSHNKQESSEDEPSKRTFQGRNSPVRSSAGGGGLAYSEIETAHRASGSIGLVNRLNQIRNASPW